MVDGCWSKLIKVVSGVPWKCFGSAVVPHDLFSIPENKLYVYADDSALAAVIIVLLFV